jgi:hypothetical protein
LAVDQEEIYKIAFATLLIFPTPLYIILPYCRHNSLLSLLSLTSIILSTCVLYYGERFGARLWQLSWLNVIFGTVIMAAGYIQHWPWKRFDFIWVLPAFSAVVSTVLRRWFEQTLGEIAQLQKAQYSTKKR